MVWGDRLGSWRRPVFGRLTWALTPSSWEVCLMYTMVEFQYLLRASSFGLRTHTNTTDWICQSLEKGCFCLCHRTQKRQHRLSIRAGRGRRWLEVRVEVVSDEWQSTVEICALKDCSPALGSSPESWRGEVDWHWNNLRRCSYCASFPARPSRLRCWCSTPDRPVDSLFPPRRHPPLL